MTDYNKLAVKHGVYGEYKNACKKESSGAGNGWRHNIEKAIDSAEKNGDIEGAMSFWCKTTALVSHTEWAGLRYRDF